MLTENTEHGADRPTLLWNLLWKVRLSGLYHLKRERFLDGTDRLTKAIGVLGGASAFGWIYSNPHAAAWAGAMVALVSTLSLVYSPSEKARRHAELARDYKRLEGAILAHGPSIPPYALSRFENDYATLESMEPAALGALVTHCHNQLCTAHDKRGEITPLKWWQDLFMNWRDWDQSQPSAKK